MWGGGGEMVVVFMVRQSPLYLRLACLTSFWSWKIWFDIFINFKVFCYPVMWPEYSLKRYDIWLYLFISFPLYLLIFFSFLQILVCPSCCNYCCWSYISGIVRKSYCDNKKSRISSLSLFDMCIILDHTLSIVYKP